MSKVKNDSKETTAQRVIREWKADTSIRAEFGSLSRYHSYVIAREYGKVKICGETEV